MALLDAAHDDRPHGAAVQVFTENYPPPASSSPSINVFTDSASFLWRSEVAGLARNRDHWEMVRAYYEE